MHSEACALLPASLGQALSRGRFDRAEEIRLRIGQPPTALIGGAELRIRDREFEQDELIRLLEKGDGRFAAQLDAVDEERIHKLARAAHRLVRAGDIQSRGAYGFQKLQLRGHTYSARVP